MKVEMAVCAQEVRNRPDGLIDVLGAGVNEIVAPRFPMYARFAVAVRLVVEETEAGRWHRLRTRLLLDGEPLASPPGVPFKVGQLNARGTTGMNLLLNLSVGLPHPGALLIELVVDDDLRIPHLRLTVREPDEVPPQVR
jgi:hypothetical protein